jgi:hypothetical protein
MSFSGQLIYDHLTPTVWNTFKNRSILNTGTSTDNNNAHNNTSSSSTAHALSKIEEVLESDEDIEETRMIHRDDETVSNLAKSVYEDLSISTAPGVKPELLLIEIVRHLGHIAPFLDFVDLVNLFSTSK